MLIEKVRQTIKETGIIQNGEHIVVGLSGGPDSVCLFHVLLKLKHEMDLKLYPVHINHKFRPGAAERDQEYVEKLCEQNGLKCRTFAVDCGALAVKLGMTDEEAGRKVRYDSFRAVAEEIAAGAVKDSAEGLPVPPEHIKIAVAQNANDQAETILFRLLRGTGPDGLAGIAYIRSEGRFSVIRPILGIYRDEIEEYCRSNNLQPRTDHTNSETVYARNRIRLKLLPQLQSEYNSNIMDALNRLGRIAGEDKEYFRQQSEKSYNQALLKQDEDSVALQLEAVQQMHRSIRHRVLMRALSVTGLTQDVTEERLAAADKIIESSGESGMKRIQLPGGYEIKISYDRLICGRCRKIRERKQSGRLADSAQISGDAGESLYGAHEKADGRPEVRFELTEDSGCIRDAVGIFEDGGKPKGAAFFDADRLQGGPETILDSLAIRHRREGDYIPLKSGRRKLKKLFIDMKIPADLRDDIWLIANGSEILYAACSSAGEAEGAGVKYRDRYAESCRPDIHTKHMLILKFV